MGSLFSYSNAKPQRPPTKTEEPAVVSPYSSSSSSSPQEERRRQRKADNLAAEEQARVERRFEEWEAKAEAAAQVRSRSVCYVWYCFGVVLPSADV